MSGIDVIVVGGGPAGACVAHALARQGVRTVVLDRARFPRAKACAEFLSPECARILDDMDALAACDGAEHARLEGMIVRAPNGRMIAGAYGRVGGHVPFRSWAYSIRRTVLDGILLERAAGSGAQVQQGTRVIDLLRDGSGHVRGVRAMNEQGTVRDVRSRFVVGADGLRSVVARRLRLRRPNGRPRRLGLVGHWQGIEGLTTFGEMHVVPGGYFGLAATGGGIANISIVVPAERAREIAGDAGGFYERWLRSQQHVAARLRGAQRVGPVLTTGPFAARSARSWAPGAALAGDAADYFDPFTGEGIYSALRAGELLAPRLLDALAASGERGADDALRAYDAERLAELAPKRLVERAIALFVAHPALMNHAATALARSRAMTDLLVGVCGDFVPPREVLDPRYIMRLLTLPWLRREPSSSTAGSPN